MPETYRIPAKLNGFPTASRTRKPLLAEADQSSLPEV
jgi:hypothetical protein